MINIKNLIPTGLNEITLSKGDFGKRSASNMFSYIKAPEANLHIDKIIDKSLLDRVSKFVDEEADDEDLLPKNLQRELLNSGERVFKSGSFYVIKVQGNLLGLISNVPGPMKGKYKGKMQVYLGFDFSQPVHNYGFFVGYIFTKKFRKAIPWSPKRTLNLDEVEQVHYSEISVEHRGRGYGKLMYDAILKTTDALYSDVELYEGSFKMWAYHIRKYVKFFGAATFNGLILPIYDETAIEKQNVENIAGFVGLKNAVPPKLIELKNFLKDRNPVDVLTINLPNGRLESIIQDIESAVSMDDLLEKRESYAKNKEWSYKKNHDCGVIITSSAAVFIRESGDELKYLLI